MKNMDQSFFDFQHGKMTIILTRNCNLKCIMCMTRGNTSTLEKDQAIRLAEFGLKQGFSCIELSGGEPFILGYTKDIIKVLKNSPTQVLITTNGTLVTDEQIDLMASCNNIHVQISLDGLAETHDQIRGVPLSFTRSDQTLRRLVARGVSVSINTVVQAINYRDMYNCYRYFSDVPYRWHGFVLYEPGSTNLDKVKIHPQDADAVESELLRIYQAARNENKPVGTLTPDSIRSIKNRILAKDDKNEFVHPGLLCTVPHRSIIVYPDGKIVPCHHHDWARYGFPRDVSKTDIADIIFSEDFKSAVRKATGPSGCKGCSTLCYSFDPDFQRKTCSPSFADHMLFGVAESLSGFGIMENCGRGDARHQVATVSISSSAPSVLQKSASPVWGRPPSGNIPITEKGVLYVGFPCNIRCKFCYYTYNQTKEWHPLEECKRDASLFREKYGNRFVDITGGEPTIYPHIYELLDFCNRIDLKPTLITNVQALANEDRVKQFRDHGVFDFLCSVHALGNTYNEIVQSRHGWNNLTEGIENLNKHGIPWRANCTLTRLNMDQLKDIVQWVKDRNCRIINFINFNPFEEWKAKMDIDFQARHCEIGPRLVQALEHCDRIGLEANVRYFPFCHMKGHEEKCINFQQLSYDRNEWDFCSWYAPETRAPSDKLPDSVRVAASSEEELHHFIAQCLKKGMYVQNGPCLQCSHFLICDGFTRQYHSRYGMEEAAPFRGPILMQPAIFIVRRAGSASIPMRTDVPVFQKAALQ